MEWLSAIWNCFVAVIEWCFMLGFYLCAFFFAVVTVVCLLVAYDERKIYKGKDYGWKLFPVLAAISGVCAYIFVLLGNLFN